MFMKGVEASLVRRNKAMNGKTPAVFVIKNIKTLFFLPLYKIEKAEIN